MTDGDRDLVRQADPAQRVLKAVGQADAIGPIADQALAFEDVARQPVMDGERMCPV
ncbi:hypothetical protein D3C87_1971200 [compost metagenome]